MDCDQATGAVSHSWDGWSWMPVQADLVTDGVQGGDTVISISNWSGAPSSWQITGAMASEVEWLASSHNWLGRQRYVRVNNKIYMTEMGISWCSPMNDPGNPPCSGVDQSELAYNRTMLYEVDQMTGEQLTWVDNSDPFNPMYHPFYASMEMDGVTAGMTLDYLTAWPGPQDSLSWTIDSYDPGMAHAIDWLDTEHGVLRTGDYVKVNGVFYNVFGPPDPFMASGSMWKPPYPDPAYNYAELQQVDQSDGTLLWDPADGGSHTMPLFADMSGATGAAIEWVGRSFPDPAQVNSIYGYFNPQLKSEVDWDAAKMNPPPPGEYLKINILITWFIRRKAGHGTGLDSTWRRCRNATTGESASKTRPAPRSWPIWRQTG
ncbi:MAG: hypothetical protein KKG47_07890 [Proteobacteria bacterium]|nr:hypothetical protein [Pseudomonadota bacterium]MBU1738221.1 hypothetical protein [Pseudomonadota bacterium]